MNKTRLEAFSDGVIAIIVTIMVLEFKIPNEATWAALKHLFPLFLTYMLSFVFVGIYWTNHHHLFHVVHKINGKILWANLHLLFWLSLTPFATAWVGENNFAGLPVAFYGVVLLFSALAYFILTLALIAHHGADSALAKALGDDRKGKASVFIYVLALGLAFVSSWAACALYVVVAVMWLIPDKRIERVIE